MHHDLTSGIYRHYKGKDYLVLGTAVHSETLETVVVYTCLHPNDTSPMWVRPLDMFTGTVEVDGETVERFRYVGSEESKSNECGSDPSDSRCRSTEQ